MVQWRKLRRQRPLARAIGGYRPAHDLIGYVSGSLSCLGSQATRTLQGGESRRHFFSAGNGLFSFWRRIGGISPSVALPWIVSPSFKYGTPIQALAQAAR